MRARAPGTPAARPQKKNFLLRPTPQPGVEDERVGGGDGGFAVAGARSGVPPPLPPPPPRSCSDRSPSSPSNTPLQREEERRTEKSKEGVDIEERTAGGVSGVGLKELRRRKQCCDDGAMQLHRLARVEGQQETTEEGGRAKTNRLELFFSFLFYFFF